MDSDPVSGTADPSDPDTEPVADTDPDDDSEAAVDLDRDGASAEVDCDDREPLVHPGAVEVWDGLDNDCDGRVDGRGLFTGAVALEAMAIVEGQTRRVEVDCTAELERLASIVRLDLTCPVPDDDDLARQLLGALLTASPVQNVAVEGRWDGTVSFVSDAPWSADGSAVAQWSSTLDQVDLSLALDTVSLQLRADGELGVGAD